MTWTFFLTSWIPSAWERTVAAFTGLSSALSWTSFPATGSNTCKILFLLYPWLFNYAKIPLLANASTEVPTTRVNTSTCEGTNIRDCICSLKALQSTNWPNPEPPLRTKAQVFSDIPFGDTESMRWVGPDSLALPKA